MLTDQQKQEIRYEYTVRLTPLADLAIKYGVSRQALHKMLRRSGVDTTKKHITTTCEVCRKEITRPKCQIRNANSLFCSRGCYYLWLNRNNYRPCSHGSRKARQIVSKYFDLQPGHIVHHIDGNQANNELGNLLVFACQKDHIRHHRGFKIEPIFKF